MKTGGGSTTSVADLPADWRQQMDDEMREALKAIELEKSINEDEFTVKDAVGIWRPTLIGTKKHLYRLHKAGAVTVRTAYDPRVERMVNVYRKVE